jgi:hypothetical protein
MPAEPRHLHFKRQLCVRTQDISEAKAAVLTVNSNYGLLVKELLKAFKGYFR